MQVICLFQIIIRFWLAVVYVYQPYEFYCFIVNSIQTSTALPTHLCATCTRRLLSPCPNLN
ncbi:hypothetical protein [Kingella kingae]|uniref:hypothetical protein n=1 Tax=Kingella kingae TaxID=504 RepID=UPI00117B5AFD|nr:hypothetical protein [Kingella kingae]MDK4537171.1 hypothetical protein [Kingella kingae]